MAVWDGAAQVGDEGGEAAAAQAQHVGGRNIVRHDDQGFVAVHMTHVRQHGGCAGQHVQHALDDLAHVGAALRSSSMASNCWPRIWPCVVSAHSAL